MTNHNHSPERVVWLTGLPASGKTTIANELSRHLLFRGQQVCVLDGDKLREGLCSDLGFSRADRRENIRRVCEVARLLADAGVICIVALISPYRSDREFVRHKVSGPQFMEVYVNAPVEVCEQRDPKGLYRKARANQIKDFTGVSAPYEPPLQPALELRTDKMSVTEAVQKVLTHLCKTIQAPIMIDSFHQQRDQIIDATFDPIGGEDRNRNIASRG